VYAHSPSPDLASPATVARSARATPTLATAWNTLRLTRQASATGLGLLVLITVMAASLPPMIISVSRELVDQVARAPLAQVGSPVPWAVALGALTVAQRMLVSLQNSRQQIFAMAVARHAERLFLEKTAHTELAQLDDPSWRDQVHRVSQDLAFRPHQVASQSITLLAALITMLGMLGVLLTLHPLLLGLAVLAVAAPAACQRSVNRRLWLHQLARTAKEREQAYYRQLLTDASSAKDVRALVLETHLLGRQQALASDRETEHRRIVAGGERAQALAAVLGGLALVYAFVFVAQRGAGGELTAGELTALIAALASLSIQVSALLNALGLIHQHAPFLQGLFSFLSARPAVAAPPRLVALPARLRGGIEFDDVVFSYPGSSRPALDHLSLRIGEGEMVALVGDNGAGKTSLIKLLLHFYDPQGGRVRVGGVDVSETAPAALRERVGVLFQDYTSFRLRARDALALGRIASPHSDEALWSALQAARADHIIRRLPRGLDNFIGRMFDQGADLSGGEWQRLALARLILRDADIWILDEPTSSLDPEAEAAVFAQLKRQLNGRIGLVISQRFSTVRMADRIAVMTDGRISELGSHDELIARGGRYAELFELQAAGYR
jgi:ATP-binding cassette, subfamily B, bacterial